MAIILLINNIEEVFTSLDRLDLEVHFIDVGQGDAILIKSKDDAVLIDSGTRVYQDRLLKYLNEEGIKGLNYIIASHPHEDHIGGLAHIINNIKTENIIMPEVTANTQSFELLINSIGSNDVNPIIAKSGDIYEIENSKFVILSPNKNRYEKLNNYSVGIKLVYGSSSFIFTGDAEDVSELEMVERFGQDLRANLLKLGHHGSNTSSTEEFLDAVNPQYAIISLGKNNEYGHPHKEVMDRLEERGITIYRTDMLASIIAKTDGEKIEFIRR